MANQRDLIDFNDLFNAYYQRFVHFAFSFVKEGKVAEDFAIEAFMSYWESRNRLTSDTNPPAYILTIIKNKCISYLRHLQTRNNVEEELADHYSWRLKTQMATLEVCNPEEIFSKEIMDIVNEALEKLPENTRNIFILSRFENLSHKEIAEKMNMTTKGVEFHIYRSLKVLRVALKDYIPSLLYFLNF